jgi:hypothetical protein
MSAHASHTGVHDQGFNIVTTYGNPSGDCHLLEAGLCVERVLCGQPSHAFFGPAGAGGRPRVRVAHRWGVIDRQESHLRLGRAARQSCGTVRPY